MNFVGKVVSYEKLSDCPETGDQRILIEVDLRPEFVGVERRRVFVLYVGRMKSPGYTFSARAGQGTEIGASWDENPREIRLFGSSEARRQFSNKIWPE